MARVENRPSILLSALVLGLAIHPAVAQQRYPSRQITIIVPFPPGGTGDTFPRLMGRRFSESMGQPVIIDNRPGAGGIVGAIAAKNAAPDGHTLLVGHKGTHSLYVLMAQKPEYDPVADFTPIGTYMVNQSILVVPPSLKVNSVAELLALAKSRPGGLNFASQGVGTSGHFLGEMFRVATGAPMTHIPTKGGAPAVTETVAGRTDFVFGAYFAVVDFVRDGKLKPIAVASNARWKTLPDVPTLPELGIHNVEFDTWFGFFGPAKMPRDIVTRLNGEIRNAIVHPDMVKALDNFKIDPLPGSPEELGKLVVDEIARYRDTVKRIGVKID
jgi:tripartite-type tricarboxylate transporter receptor subunit TctC